MGVDEVVIALVIFSWGILNSNQSNTSANKFIDILFYYLASMEDYFIVLESRGRPS